MKSEPGSLCRAVVTRPVPWPLGEIVIVAPLRMIPFSLAHVARLSRGFSDRFMFRLEDSVVNQHYALV